MSKKIAIYDVDSKIPNLAIMKISAYHKQQGDDVEMYVPLFKDSYDKIYASKIFNFSDGSLLDEEKMIIGGTGYNMMKNLPQEIEDLQPDYQLYNYPHNIGFTMRGCRLKCSFCVVPKKEGKPKANNTIDEIWQQRDSNFVMLLDNDFFGNPEWKDRIEEIKEYKLKVNFSQGLNIRNIKEDQALALASINFTNAHATKKQVTFAWDDPRHEKLIHKGIERVTDCGLKPYQMAFYVLIGYHSTEEEDLHRVETLRSYGCDPYVMPYDKFDDYQKKFTRWVNRKAIFKSVAWKDYKSRERKKIINENQQELLI
jgi:hypothetical protein